MGPAMEMMPFVCTHAIACFGNPLYTCSVVCLIAYAIAVNKT